MKKLILLFTTICLLYFKGFSQNTYRQEIERFATQLGAIATIDSATQSLSYLRLPPGQPLQLAGSTPEQKARNFISSYARLFSSKTQGVTHLVKDIKRDIYGSEHVTLQQYYEEVPIFDGVLRFHFDRNGNLTSLNGNYIISEKLNVTPQLALETAEQRAIQFIKAQKQKLPFENLRAVKSSLMVFQKGLAQGYKGPLHLAYEIQVGNEHGIREFLYIDAQTGNLIDQFTGTHAIDRKLYDVSVSPVNLKWQESDGIPSPNFTALDNWQKSILQSSEHIYNLMKHTFGMLSYDNNNATMVSISNDPAPSCPNAFWDGQKTRFCSNISSDDVVAHEWAHAYTQYTSGLLYAYQSGSLNESYSDIWGETVDLLNGYLDTGENIALRNGCASSARWQIAEQATGFGGILRDMWDPTCKGSPGKMSDPQFKCTANDDGGVHTNSGVINHAYALLVDGGNYNGYNINGLGLTKAAHIFWYAQSTHVTSTTDFAAQADILEASLVELIGVNLPSLTTGNAPAGPSGIIIAGSDLAELQKVLLAVEMRGNGCLLNPNSQPLLGVLPPLCKGAAPGNAIFFENFETGLNNWTVSNAGTAPSWTPRNWIIDDTAPDGRPGKVAFAVNWDGGDCANDIQSGIMSLTSPAISIPANTIGQVNLAFDHYVSLENDRDGANIKYRIGGGNWILVPKNAFTDNPYNTVLVNCWNDCSNPLWQQDAFTGADGGSLSSTWGQSRINLTSLGLSPGQTIQFRWDVGTDGCSGWDGWYIDNVRVYSCSQPTVQFTTTETVVSEGEAQTNNPVPDDCLPFIEKVVTIKINEAPSQPVTVNLNVAGNATGGMKGDYYISPTSVTLSAANLSQNVSIRIYNDSYAEGNEAATLSYTLVNLPGGNATPELFDQEHKLTILDDDVAPGSNSMELFSADFNAGLPNHWVVKDGGKFPADWDVVDYKSDLYLDPAGTPFLYLNTGWGFQSQGQIDRIIETPTFNGTGMKTLQISYLEHFWWNDGFSNFKEQAYVDVWDGTSWHNLLTQNQLTGASGLWQAPFARNITIPIAYAHPAMRIRFRYQANWSGWWAIDNLKVIGIVNNDIRTDLTNQTADEYLGPNKTVFFKHPVSGELIAKIKNLTDHNYGCTSVDIDRVGIDITDWVGINKITNKTFKVTPTYPNPNKEIEITLYYRTTELPTFNGSKIKSIGKSTVGIPGSSLINSTTLPVSASPFISGIAFTAISDGGTNGFGLSDVLPGNPLPVTLSSFDGINVESYNVLTWETENETNSSHFYIERSIDGRTFDSIGQITAKHNSSTQIRYSFIDSTFLHVTNYYRLRLVDLDGSYSFSRVVYLKTSELPKLVTYPNPVDRTLTLSIRGNEFDPVSIEIINVAGQSVLSRRNAIRKGKDITVDLTAVPEGVYQVIVSTSKLTYRHSIIKAP